MAGRGARRAGRQSLEPTYRDRAVAWAHQVRAHSTLLRKVAAGFLVLAACALAITSGEQSKTVVTAARDLSAGEEVSAADVTLTRVPRSAIPAAVLDRTDAATGRRTAAPLRAGEFLTETRLLTPHVVDEIVGISNARGVPIRLSDPGVAALLRAGDRVDVVSVSPQYSASERALDSREPASTILVENAAVLFVTEASHGSDPLVVLGLTPSAAMEVAAASIRDAVTITLRS